MNHPQKILLLIVAALAKATAQAADNAVKVRDAKSARLGRITRDGSKSPRDRMVKAPFALLRISFRELPILH